MLRFGWVNFGRLKVVDLSCVQQGSLTILSDRFRPFFLVIHLINGNNRLILSLLLLEQTLEYAVHRLCCLRSANISLAEFENKMNKYAIS